MSKPVIVSVLVELRLDEEMTAEEILAALRVDFLDAGDISTIEVFDYAGDPL